MATTRAIASRAVMNESAKWRSGRAWVRTVSTFFSGRGGKSADPFGDHEREADQGNRDVVMPAGEAPALEMVESQLALEVLVDAFGA